MSDNLRPEDQVEIIDIDGFDRPRVNIDAACKVFDLPPGHIAIINDLAYLAPGLKSDGTTKLIFAAPDASFSRYLVPMFQGRNMMDTAIELAAWVRAQCVFVGRTARAVVYRYCDPETEVVFTGAAALIAPAGSPG